MAYPAVKQEYFTYAQYKNWPEEERWELIDGIPYALAAPSRRHQDILTTLFLQIGNFLKDKKCKVYVAPFDVRLFKKGANEDEIDNVVQPDISVFCDESKLDKKGAIGAPDWVIEILSDSTSENDLNRKMMLYLKYKVKEYWIVSPDKNTVLVHKLNEFNHYFPIVEITEKSTIAPTLFPKLKIKLQEVFNQ